MHVIGAIAEAAGLVEAVGLLLVAGAHRVHEDKAPGVLALNDSVGEVVGAVVEFVAALSGFAGVADAVCSATCCGFKKKKKINE